MSKEEKNYSHTDLYACAFMVAHGINILRMDKIDDYNSRFIMNCSVEEGRELYKRYRENEKIGVMTMKYALRQAKDILFNKQR